MTPWTAARQASLSLTISQSLPKFMSIKSVMLSNHLILCHLLLLPSVFPSIRVFSSESALCVRWLKCGFSISPSNEYSGLISIRIDWSYLPAVQGTLKSLRSSSPARTPKSQLTAEQPSTEGCWNPPKKDTLCPRIKEKPQQDGTRGTITLKSP